jgi:hypothetical protein
LAWDLIFKASNANFPASLADAYIRGCAKIDHNRNHFATQFSVLRFVRCICGKWYVFAGDKIANGGTID